jgi:hypothetical protein
MLMHRPKGPSEIDIFCCNPSMNEICKNLCISCVDSIIKRVNTVDEILFDGGGEYKKCLQIKAKIQGTVTE